MEKLKERIIAEGVVFPGNILHVGSFLNQRIDTTLAKEMAKEIVRIYMGCNITAVVTMEASGIALAFAVASVLTIPLVFAKKNKTANLGNNLLTSNIHSYTHQKDYIASLDADFLTLEDTVLIVDDFLANGEAIRGMIDLINQSGAKLIGCAIAIEKGFQGAGDRLRSEGIRVESLAIIESMSKEDGIVFR